MLAGAAQASGAVFRESPALQGESAGKRSKAPLTNKAASADKTVQNGKREILHPRFESASAAKANAGHREDRSGRADRPLQTAAGRSAKADSRQNRQLRSRRPNLPESGQARTENGRQDTRALSGGRSERSARPKLSWAERRNPIPPFELMPGLPVSERAADVVKAIKENQVVIVCGETGSGKTTQLPKICLMAGRGETGRIGHTQPRRIAASSIAKRIAEELKTPLGDVVGYKVRFTDQTASGATIKLMTDGILLAETQGDPLLKAYDTIIIDEAHERSINIDFLLGYLKRLLPKRPDLKVIVTSATIDAERFANHFAVNGKPAPVLTISGRTYPVEIRWRPVEDRDEDDDRTMLAAIDDAVSECEMSGRGDILVFLPGEREINAAAEELRRSRIGKAEILLLYARLSAADQDKIFKPSGNMRRIVLATNVAETSVTVPGIRYVVDTGYARIKRYSYRSKVSSCSLSPLVRLLPTSARAAAAA